MAYKGQFEIFKLVKKSELICYSTDEGNEHDSPLISVDVHHLRKLIITASHDQRIKIWTMRKVLLL